MDDEDEGDWDSDEEEQAELAAAEAAAKGKVVGNVRGGFDCRGGRGLDVFSGCRCLLGLGCR
jgi:hypothetical protein